MPTLQRHIAFAGLAVLTFSLGMPRSLARAEQKTPSRRAGAAPRSALDALLADAERVLRASAFSVMDKELVPPSGNKHDYMSTAPYWWPDPSKPNGLPYIRRDGEHNPDHNSNRTDSHALHSLFSSVQTLALAYHETGEERYAASARKLLRVWFLDPATRMNPNLNYGQAIAGRVEGRGTGIIETRGLADLTQALGWLAGSKAWTRADQQGMKIWLAQYLDWLLTSENGRAEATARNNHGSWYDVQVASLALFTGKRDLARRVIEEAKTKRIAVQIEPDGSQPLELERTLSFGYSLFNLQALFDLADLGNQVGVDLWHYEAPGGRSLRKALDCLAPYLDPAKTWPHTQLQGVSEGNRMALAVLLRRAALVYHEPRYEDLLSRLPAKDVQANRMQLLWPAGVTRL